MPLWCQVKNLKNMLDTRILVPWEVELELDHKGNLEEEKKDIF